ncbi:FG-GAP repeat domain-containing protein [Aureitalea marina]|uniref:Cytochrome c domain-containing protein n=1 Tax=Aureitalea marina TaxID=930804 RepID=A0A2S7KTD1_9FLAO|nr:VCBS repeat-containing protein [Aureitalea marina]PQB03454.1 hypothetical protein BST85_00015 [Aureitalea marina]PQB05884.1 hypothetical protein BST85_13980 [Aureitalea marina]
MRPAYTMMIAITLVFTACKDEGRSRSEDKQIVSEKVTGESLSRIYCASCHQYPPPSTLDKETWEEFMLPRMGYMFGIYNSQEEREALFEKNEGGEIVRRSNLFPAQRTIDSLDWEMIVDYYLKNAPLELAEPDKLPIAMDLDRFELIVPSQKVRVPSSTMANFAPDGSIYLGDAMTGSFSVFSSDLQLRSTGNVQEGAVSLFDDGERFWLTVMGSFSPTDAPRGLIATLPKTTGENASVPITELQRPVHSSFGDMDGDGDQDVVVAEFGKWTGALSLHLMEDGEYRKVVLHNTPGAIKSYIKDMNGDGKLDIVALFAQGSEGIDIFYNDGRANFRRERVLEFSPSMGSSFMNLIDYNKDGYPDIVFTAGDNADYKPLMKPWHGVYIFINDGQNNFRQEVFLHLNGAYNAVVEDFDLDGDTDIAAISFFPDWVNTPEEGFVYFENEKGEFSASTFEQVNAGRWVVMDAADYDQDGDLDLVLGSLAFEVVPKLGYVEKWVEKGIPFIVLKNRSR